MRKTVPFLWFTFSIWMILLLAVGVSFVSSAFTSTSTTISTFSSTSPNRAHPPSNRIKFISSKLLQPNTTNPTPDTAATSSSSSSTRVKRGYHGQGRSYSTGIAYNRINDSGQVRSVGDRHRDRGHGNEGKRGGRGRSAVGEDGSHTNDFKSYGVGYEHRHSGHCEESKCGYNIRHCPHGCVFNSFQCGGGAAYDTCCC